MAGPALLVRERLAEGLDEIVAERAHGLLLLVSVLMLAGRVAAVRRLHSLYNPLGESGIRASGYETERFGAAPEMPSIQPGGNRVNDPPPIAYRVGKRSVYWLASEKQGLVAMAGTAQHVVPRDGRWAVRKGGAERVTRRYDTQREAVDAAREIARRQRTEVFVHGRDGRSANGTRTGMTHFRRRARRSVGS